MAARIGGVVYLRINGKLYTAGEGEFTFNTGGFKRAAKLGSGGVAGFNATATVPFLEGEMIHTADLDEAELKTTENATITLELYNGKTFILYDAWYASEGDFSSEGTIKVRFEGLKGELING